MAGRRHAVSVVLRLNPLMGGARSHAVSLLLALCGFRAAGAASDSLPHYHTGRLTPYKIEAPNLLLSAADERALQAGKPVMQALVADDGETRRMVMVQDIPAPSSVVLGCAQRRSTPPGAHRRRARRSRAPRPPTVCPPCSRSRIVDFNKYSQMVSGVDRCVTYASCEGDGLQTTKSTYEISALHLRLKYYMEHTYSPEARCMTFRLDYDKRSDIDDSVGYWYVDPTGRASCRVFYSCECKLRGWVPPPVYNILTKEALKKATVWVSAESVKEWRSSRAAGGHEALVHFLDDVRTSFDQNFGHLQLPRPLRPRRAGDWIERRRREAVRFVSGARPPSGAPARVDFAGNPPEPASD